MKQTTSVSAEQASESDKRLLANARQMLWELGEMGPDEDGNYSSRLRMTTEWHKRLVDFLWEYERSIVARIGDK